MAIAQNLNSMPIAQRDSLLISIAKDAILKFAQDYYREYKEPIIECWQIPLEGGENAGKISYRVTFLYNKTEETLELDYAASVAIQQYKIGTTKKKSDSTKHVI